MYLCDSSVLSVSLFVSSPYAILPHLELFAYNPV
ncbi:protein of unknown function [Candidatus Promineifilum breve]|uniref:Uncharacterized protein n=1 Tax=Candidatus Promineifilum breve TaxID=1806508 RepID=A0A160TA21_9CHLR|nr:protein of unknown function [Candidatus Promineifilum breve]